MAMTRIAFVSGANRGIGLEIVRQLAEMGLAVVLGTRDLAKGRAAAEKLTGEGLQVTTIGLDVDDETSPARALAEIRKTFGRCDILVNNAAILIDDPGGFNASLCDLTAGTLRQTFETNVLGPMRLIQAVAPLMRENKYGRIVNLSSGAGQFAGMGSGYPAYRLSKAALNALTCITASEFAGDNIKVNAVCPGWVRTDMGGPNADRPVEKGAETPVWLATLPDDGPTGGFFRDKTPIPW